MKRVVLLLCLAAVIILSGCFPFMLSQGANPVPNSEIAESLISRMINNNDTHTLEGFTSESTYCEVLEKIEPESISNARLVYDSQLLGYPAAVSYSFSYYGGELVLDYINFDIYPVDGNSRNGFEAEELLAKLDAELGSHKKESDLPGDTEYIWKKDGWCISMDTYEVDYESDTVVFISVYAPLVINGILPKIPDIFPYQFGTDIHTIYQSETPDLLPEDFDNDCYLEYKDDGIEIDLRFQTDEKGEITLKEGGYFINLNYMNFEDSTNYFKNIADSLETALGEPDERSEHDGSDFGQKYYRIDMDWQGIYFSADSDSWPVIFVDFSEEYLDSI